MRQGLKEYSEWPTYPQLYAGGELLGGCDIILEMHEKGELLPAIQEAVKEVVPASNNYCCYVLHIVKPSVANTLST